MPTVILHAQGGQVSGLLASELAIDGFDLAIAADPGAVVDHDVDVIVAERQHIDPRGLIDDIRRYFPEARLVSIATIGTVTIAHAFAGVPRANELERLRTLASGVRRAAKAGTTGTR